MAQKNIVEVGDRCGRLVVEALGVGKKRLPMALCKCDCGTRKTIIAYTIRKSMETGKGTQSCGCLKAERLTKYNQTVKPGRTHGETRTPTYYTWQNMIERCRNENAKDYEIYGGVGITVCERWTEEGKGYQNFVEDMGRRPTKNHTIDRKESTKGYTPENCRWATSHQQATNRVRKNKHGYRGVVDHNSNAFPWKAKIRVPGEIISLGTYETIEEAALAYNVASIELHGEFGIRNELPKLSKKVIDTVTSRVSQYLENRKQRRR